MNLPWDKSYFKACFYAVFTFILIYIAKKIIDGSIYAIINLGDIYTFTLDAAGKICSVFSIIIGGFITAYIIKPLVSAVYKRTGWKYGNCAGIVFALLFMALAVSIWAVMYTIDYAQLRKNIKIYADNTESIYNSAAAYFESHNMTLFESISDEIKKNIYGYISDIGNNVLNISKKLAQKAVTLLLSVVVAFYMIKDEYEITSRLKEYLSVFINEKWRKKLYSVVDDMDRVFSGYLRGQLADGFIMAGLISLGLSALKVPFALGIGIFSGFSNLIPYFGSITGFILSVTAAFVSGEPVRALYAGIFILVLQQIDSAFIVPKVVGESVKLSPVMIIISLAVAGKLFGIWGMVFAVPVVAVIKLRLDRFCERRVINGKVYRKRIEENRND